MSPKSSRRSCLVVGTDYSVLSELEPPAAMMASATSPALERHLPRDSLDQRKAKPQPCCQPGMGAMCAASTRQPPGPRTQVRV